MRRRELREHVFKLLFMLQFNSKEEMPEQLVLYFDSLADLDETDQSYMEEKYRSILAHLEEIDGILNEYSSGWKTGRMSNVDLTTLRLALYEMKYEEDVPTGVAINEAVELAKCFGGESSGSFVNGVLGKIASGHREGGEPVKSARRPDRKAKIIIKSKKDHGASEKTSVSGEKKE